MLRYILLAVALCLSCSAEPLKSDSEVNRFWKRQVESDYQMLLANPQKALKWTAPRLDITEAEMLKGRGELESFASVNMPNAFRQYEKAKERAEELQQVFREDFPAPETIKVDHPERKGFERVLHRLCEARARYFRTHDELAHFYLMKKACALTAEELARIDASPIVVKLGREFPSGASFEIPSCDSLPAKYVEFVRKYMPMTQMIYPKLEEERGLAIRLLGEMKTAIREMDIVREEPCRDACLEKVKKITEELEEIRKIYHDYRIGDLDVETLAERDRNKGAAMKSLFDSLPGFVAAVLVRPSAVTDICGFRMVKIPERDYWIGETEVTQGQWEEMMAGYLPKPFTDYDKPAYGVSLCDCWEFIFRLNSRPDVVASGYVFRLPNGCEWEHACRAGSKSCVGRRRNGEEGPIVKMGWCRDNSGIELKPVAQLEANAWGLYDMHGNVYESIGRKGTKAAFMGGGYSDWDNSPQFLGLGGSMAVCDFREEVIGKGSSGSEFRSPQNGFRLLAIRQKVDNIDKVDFGALGAKAGDVRVIKLPGGVSMEMVYCPPGSFLMGSPTSSDLREKNEEQHNVKLTKGFWMGKYEVTQKQWVAVMGDNPSYFKKDDHPVECVTWEQCQYFVKKLGMLAGLPLRLPTEAEWEFACRAGTTTDLPSGEDLVVIGKSNAPRLDPIAWYSGNSNQGFDLADGADCSDWPEMQYEGKKAGTHPVGQRRANAWGFHDMIGNVNEWCSDWFDEMYYAKSPSSDPENKSSPQVFEGNTTYRVVRGGSWFSGARLCRSADRSGLRPSLRNNSLGFRLCCSAGPRE